MSDNEEIKVCPFKFKHKYFWYEHDKNDNSIMKEDIMNNCCRLQYVGCFTYISCVGEENCPIMKK